MPTKTESHVKKNAINDL